MLFQLFQPKEILNVTFVLKALEILKVGKVILEKVLELILEILRIVKKERMNKIIYTYEKIIYEEEKIIKEKITYQMI